ncbi:SNF2-related protein, partial [Anaerovorax odorimutans]
MRFQPHPYQQYCIQRMITDPAIGLFLDMGLGKTVITLTAINDLKYNRFQVSKVLVIAPKKVAEATWSKEAEKWDHLSLLRIMPVLGSRQKRIRALNTPADVYVINRENVQWIVDYYRNAWPFDMVVIDELTSFKSHKAKRFKSLTWVRKS